LETIVKKLYEAMFLVDSAQAASDWDGIIGAIETILKRAEAEIVSMKKWDERRLAYEIKKKSRGTYILCYFRADGQKISAIERDAQLSERVMRVLILSAEAMSQEDVDKETPIEQAENRRRQVLKEAAGKDRTEQAAVREVQREKIAKDAEAEKTAVEASKEDKDLEKEARVVVEDSEKIKRPGPVKSEQGSGASGEQDKL